MRLAKIVFCLILLLILIGGVVRPVQAQGPSPTSTPNPSKQPSGIDLDPFKGFREGVDSFGKTLALIKDWPSEFLKGLGEAVNKTLELFFETSADFYFGSPLPEFGDLNSVEALLIQNIYKVALLVGFPILMLVFFYRLSVKFSSGEQEAMGLVNHLIWTTAILFFSAAPLFFLGSLFGGTNALIRDMLHGESEFLPRLNAVDSLKNLLVNVLTTPSFVWFLLITFLVFFGSRIILRLLRAVVYMILGSMSLGWIGIVSVAREPDQAMAKKTVKALFNYFSEFVFTYLILALFLNLITTEYLLPVASWLLLVMLLILDQAPTKIAQAVVNLINPQAQREVEVGEEDSVLGGIEQSDESLPKSYRRE